MLYLLVVVVGVLLELIDGLLVYIRHVQVVHIESLELLQEYRACVLFGLECALECGEYLGAKVCEFYQSILLHGLGALALIALLQNGLAEAECVGSDPVDEVAKLQRSGLVGQCVEEVVDKRVHERQVRELHLEFDELLTEYLKHILIIPQHE